MARDVRVVHNRPTSVLQFSNTNQYVLIRSIGLDKLDYRASYYFAYLSILGLSRS